MIRWFQSLHKLALLLSLIAVSQICGLVKVPSSAYYAILISLLFYYLFIGHFKKFSMSLLSLVLISAVGILISGPAVFFKSEQRLILFVILLTIVSPLIESEALIELRIKTFLYFLNIITLLSVLSFPCFYLGINFMIRDGMDYLVTVGGFGGLYNHSMVLGPMSAISSISLFVKLLEFQKNNERRKVYITFALFLCTIGSTFLSASRTAVLGIIIVLLIMFFKRYSYSLTRLVKAFFILCSMLVFFSPVLENISNRVMSKQAGNIAAGGGSFSSRQSIWDVRLKEIESKPMLGVGFGAVSTKSGALYDKTTGQIEPGSSWLYILSSTGLLGFAAFAAFAIPSYIRLYKNMNRTAYSSTVFGVVLFFAMAMVTEGYVLSGGSTICLILWLAFGNSSQAALNKIYQLEK